MRYRRARSLIYVIGLFWLWLWLGSAAWMAGLYHSPLHAMLAMYALAVFVLISIPAALLAGTQMVLARPRADSAPSEYRAVVVELPAPPQQPPLAPAHWWFGEKAS